jgi:hypothetical protein
MSAIMLGNPTMSRWAATNRAVKMIDVARRFGAQPESIVRRLHRKWPAEGRAIFEQVEAERQRRAERVQPSPRQAVGIQIPFALLDMTASMPRINPVLVSSIPLTSVYKSHHALFQSVIPMVSVLRSHEAAFRAALPTFTMQRAALRSALPMFEIKHSFVSAFRNVPRMNIAPAALGALARLPRFRAGVFAP